MLKRLWLFSTALSPHACHGAACLGNGMRFAPSRSLRSPLRTHTHKHTLFRFCEIHPPFSSPDCINIAQAYPLLTRKEWKKRRCHGRGRTRRWRAHEIPVLLEFYVHQIKALCFLLRKREFGGDVAVFYNAVLILSRKTWWKVWRTFQITPPYFSPCFAEVPWAIHLASTWRHVIVSPSY